MYELLEVLTCSSIAVVSYNFFLIIAEFFLLSSSVLISSMLSRMFPLLYDNNVKMLSCAYLSNFLPYDIETTTSSFCL